MNFGGWFPLDDAPAVAPESAGLLQARADALVAYPKGKSAMVLYARSSAPETLRQYVSGRGAAALGRAAGIGARWIRFGESQNAEGEFARVMRRFQERFGARPAANAGVPDGDDEEARSIDG